MRRQLDEIILEPNRVVGFLQPAPWLFVEIVLATDVDEMTTPSRGGGQRRSRQPVVRRRLNLSSIPSHMPVVKNDVHAPPKDQRPSTGR